MNIFKPKPQTKNFIKYSKENEAPQRGRLMDIPGFLHFIWKFTCHITVLNPLTSPMFGKDIWK